jgi:hypothetical protein
MAGASILAASLPARAQSPNLYYAWRSLDGDVATCINRSSAALAAGELSNIQVEGNSVAGTTEAATAVLVCLDNLDSTTVMIMVTSNDDAIALNLREALKELF